MLNTIIRFYINNIVSIFKIFIIIIKKIKLFIHIYKHCLTNSVLYKLCITKDLNNNIRLNKSINSLIDEIDKNKSNIRKSIEKYNNIVIIFEKRYDNTLSKNDVPNEFCKILIDMGILSITEIFTIYYFKDKRHFFDNAMDWLMPGGWLIVHLVDRETFDPILPPGNPLFIVSPQKYAKERITKTKVHFNDFTYESNFNLDKDNDLATFDEKFKFDNGSVRKQQQKLYMEDTSTIVNMAQDCGFILQGKVDLVKCAYENQYLYIFLKPS